MQEDNGVCIIPHIRNVKIRLLDIHFVFFIVEYKQLCLKYHVYKTVKKVSCRTCWLIVCFYLMLCFPFC